MYKSFYGFQKLPFSVTPDTDFFFPSSKHVEALSSMVYAIKEKKGFVALTGEIGAGKTTVCHLLLNKLDVNVKTAMITNTLLTRKQMLESICNEFGLKRRVRPTKLELIELLQRFLIQQYKKDNHVILIIDEAQNLSMSTLEEVRLLSNLETEKDKLLQILLIGQPELKETLERPELRQLKQRICISYHISPFSNGETINYINHRLKIAGSNGGVRFSSGALQSIHQYSGGIPRLINIACDQTLLLGYVRETKKISQALVFDAIGQERSDKEVTGNKWQGQLDLLSRMKLGFRILFKGR